MIEYTDRETVKGEPADERPVTPGTLTTGDESAIRAWLAHIGEQDLAIIGEALTEPRHARWIVTYDDGSTEVLEGNPMTRAEARCRRPGAHAQGPGQPQCRGRWPTGNGQSGLHGFPKPREKWVQKRVQNSHSGTPI